MLSLQTVIGGGDRRWSEQSGPWHQGLCAFKVAGGQWSVGKGRDLLRQTNHMVVPPMRRLPSLAILWFTAVSDPWELAATAVRQSETHVYF